MSAVTALEPRIAPHRHPGDLLAALVYFLVSIPVMRAGRGGYAQPP